jgi:cell division protein FtsB
LNVKLFSIALPCVLALALAGGVDSAAAQTTATNADIQRLQNTINDTARDVAQLQGRDGALAADLQSELDDVRDEATYFKVRIRRQEPVASADIADLRDRLENIRSRARGDITGGSSDPRAPRSTDRLEDRNRDASATGGQRVVADEVPVGTEFDVRLQTPLSSATAQVEDRFQATTMVDLLQGDRVLVPAGSLVRGVVRSVNKATRVERKGSLTVSFDRMTIHGRSYPIRGTVTQALESEGVMGEKEKIGAGAGVGAIIGGILGGVKGALAGILVGGGGVLAATEGKDVNLQPGAVLRVRLDGPLDLGR